MTPIRGISTAPDGHAVDRVITNDAVHFDGYQMPLLRLRHELSSLPYPCMLFHNLFPCPVVVPDNKTNLRSLLVGILAQRFKLVSVLGGPPPPPSPARPLLALAQT